MSSSSKPCSPNSHLITRQAFFFFTRCIGAVGDCASYRALREERQWTIFNRADRPGDRAEPRSVGWGNRVKITGDHFAGGAVVTIGGGRRDRCRRRIPDIDHGEDRCAHAAGASDVMRGRSGRTGALPGAFTYDVDTAPVISSVVAHGTRPNEPQNFADLDEEVAVTAAVEDPDTPLTG